MSTGAIRKRKWFFSWQDEKEEAWLEEMSRQGMHLQKVDTFGRYTFVQGEPCPYAYRLDFVTQANKKPDYYQLFRDAGWEHAGEMGGWQYWRKRIVDGRVPEIFTDNASKILKYQRLLALLLPFFPIAIIYLANHNNREGLEPGSFLGILYEVGFFLFFLIAMVFLFMILMIIRRISLLKRK